MKKILAILVLACGLGFAQYTVEKTITFTDSVAVTDSIQVPKGSFPTLLTMGDWDTITELEFEFKFWDSTTWYPVFAADSNFAVAVSDDVVIALPETIFKKLKASTWDHEPLYMRLNPNDSDTTARSVKIKFESE